jgi:hypothetical protein
MKNIILKRLLWFAAAAGVLFVSFLVSSHIINEIFGNRQWTGMMFVFALGVVFLASFPAAKRLIICTAAGYFVSMLAGIIFNFEYDVIVNNVVQSHSPTWWIIWTLTYLAIIAAGVVWELIIHIRKKKNRREGGGE